ncbi:MAG: EAL domain-containing response regulator, partial [Rhodospirillales bacterium]|nr:EAL domain-containing response regulator [Rhodospirillales bacterium]
MSSNRLLVIDDEPAVAEVIGNCAEKLDFGVTIVTEAESFWASYSASPPSVILLDLQMPRTDGVELLRALAEKECSAHVGIISGADSRVLATARRIGEDNGLNMLGTLQKPVRMQDLRAMLRKAINEKQTVSAGDLSQAIKDDQLIVHYQPKVDLGSERQWDIKACEALVRWEHPRYGLLMPDRFIALAENSDLILPLTNCVLGMVLRQLREWDKDG